MAWPARKLRGGKRTAHLLFYISIKKATASQKPDTSGKVSKKRSKIWKTTAREKRKKHEEMAKHPKERTSGPPRGVRRRQQKKRVSFGRAKQPLPAFFLFMAQHRPQLQKSNPQWTAVETAKTLGKLWHKQPEKDKEMYKEKAAQLRRRKQKRPA
ncbi:PREDICTED: high mobility group protein B2-like [Phaethon lepturus]|uniref:high mobility group protein B2-like n=1 Tax=Phaethon lepturus TaxID=97097 RepID=UPI0005306625|nr:PREDICTED: high mobility group protein B2-like [Phaethon lepturus]